MLFDMVHSRGCDGLGSHDVYITHLIMRGIRAETDMRICGLSYCSTFVLSTIILSDSPLDCITTNLSSMERGTYLTPLSSCNIVDRHILTRDQMLLIFSVWITQNLMCMTPPVADHLQKYASQEIKRANVERRGTKLINDDINCRLDERKLTFYGFSL